MGYKYTAMKTDRIIQNRFPKHQGIQVCICAEFLQNFKIYFNFGKSEWEET